MKVISFKIEMEVYTMKKIKYFLDNIVSKGTPALMMLLVFISLFFVLSIGSIAYFIRTDGIDYATTLWYTFNHIVDPGYLFGQGGESIGFLALMTVATFWGILVYSLIISFVSTALFAKLEELKTGRSVVYEKQHTVILDFNATVPIILKELLEAHKKDKRHAVVILSEKSPDEVYHQIRQILPKQNVLKIIVRTGSIYRKEDLDMVQVGDASAIIITTLHDVMTIKTLLALKQTSFYGDNNLNHAVCLIRDYKNLDMARELGGKHLEVMYTAELKSKIFARSTIHPGLSSIYKNIFSFEDEEIYFLKDRSFVGKTIETLALTLNHSSVMGIFKQGVSYINPKKDTLFEEDDQLIVISSEKNHFDFVDASPIDISPYFNSKPYIFSNRQILTIGYNKMSLYVAKDMEQYVGTNSRLTMLLPNDASQTKITSKFDPKKYVQFESFVGETYARKNLEQFDLSSFDTIAIFANQDVTHDNADAETLLTLLHLHNLTKNLDIKPSIVIEIEETKNVDALAYVNVDDFLVSNVLVSKIMAQIAENRHTNRVIQELISDMGNEFHLKRANGYLAEGTYRMIDIQQAVLQKNQLFMGYKKLGQPIILNPDKLHTETFGPKDRFVVIATE